MRIKCTIKTKKLPIDYHFLFVSLIKKALSITDKTYYSHLYNYEDNKANKKSKNFTFCVLLDSYRIENDEFILDEIGNIYLKISSSDMKFMLFLYNGLIKIKTHKYKECQIEILNVNKEAVREIKKNKISCCFKSPLVLKNKEEKFIDFNNVEFEKEINYYANMNLKNYRGYGLKKKIQVSNINMKRIVIKEKSKEIKMLKNNLLYINGSIGEMQLEGDKTDLQDLYDMGLGARRSQGFGYFDIK